MHRSEIREDIGDGVNERSETNRDRYGYTEVLETWGNTVEETVREERERGTQEEKLQNEVGRWD